jgi:hypothetical protein
MLLSGIGSPIFTPAVHAQVSGTTTGQGLTLVAGDLRFIYQQILVAQDHAAGGTLLGNGVNQVSDPQLPRGLRTVDGSFNNLVPVPDQHTFGQADLLFPRVTGAVDAAGNQIHDATGNIAGSFRPPYDSASKNLDIVDPTPRIISNLIVDQSLANPAAKAAATNPCAVGGFVCQETTDPPPTDPDSGALFVPNITPDFGLSAPFNLMFTFFGQFFDHGLDLVTKRSTSVIMPRQPDDPLFITPTPQNPNPPNFMVMPRGMNQPGPDGVVGTNDDIMQGQNTTTPWVDQNQTYTSHPSHQVFLREYQRTVTGAPILPPQPNGKVLDGNAASCTFRVPRAAATAGVTDDGVCDIGDWAEVKDQARRWLGIRLVDQDVFNVPLILTDPYGHFKPGPLRGMPQVVITPAVAGGNPTLREGDPAANGGLGISIVDAVKTGHAFLNDIAHNAAPNAGLTADTDTDLNIFNPVTGVTTPPQTPGTFDNELLERHFVTGDGRGNENIAVDGPPAVPLRAQPAGELHRSPDHGSERQRRREHPDRRRARSMACRSRRIGLGLPRASVPSSAVRHRDAVPASRVRRIRAHGSAVDQPVPWRPDVDQRGDLRRVRAHRLSPRPLDAAREGGANQRR